MAQFRKDTHQYLADGKTIFEVMMLADQYGNLVGPANPSGMSVDGFGRARMSTPLTLFESFSRYRENDKMVTANSSGGTYAMITNTASIDCTVNSTSGAYVYRESKRVFAYQPGKSLQTLLTFVMNPEKTNLRQRVGYFSSDNGFFLERSSVTASGVSFVRRSKATGVVVDTPVDQDSWNIDKLDGTGPSLLTLDLDSPQILFIDIEWLGVGSVRMGFVINGQLIHCHTFHHANSNSAVKGAYMQTACLPTRAEIENTAATASNSTLKLVCSTVISEGGYTPSGLSRTFGQELNAQYQLASAGTYYPVITLRLNPNNLDAIVLPREIDILPINSANYKWKLVYNPTIAGATWANVASDSSVQYQSNSSATMSGGTDLDSGFISSTVQAGGSVQLHDGLFKYQLERNSFTSTPIPLTLAITCSAATSNVCAAMTWEEVS